MYIIKAEKGGWELIPCNSPLSYEFVKTQVGAQIIEVAMHFNQNDDWLALCDENGIMKDLPITFLRPTDNAPLHGPIIFVSGSNLDNIAPLSHSQATGIAASLETMGFNHTSPEGQAWLRQLN